MTDKTVATFWSFALHLGLIRLRNQNAYRETVRRVAALADEVVGIARDLLAPVLLIASVLGTIVTIITIVTGIATPTEGAAIGAAARCAWRSCRAT